MKKNEETPQITNKNFSCLLLSKMLKDVNYLNKITNRFEDFYFLKLNMNKVSHESWDKIKKILDVTVYNVEDDSDDDDNSNIYDKFGYSSKDLFLVGLKESFCKDWETLRNLYELDRVLPYHAFERLSKLPDNAGIICNNSLYSHMVDYLYEKDPAILRKVWFPSSNHSIQETKLFKNEEWKITKNRGLYSFLSFDEVKKCVKKYNKALPLFKIESVSYVNNKNPDYLKKGFIYRKSLTINALFPQVIDYFSKDGATKELTMSRLEKELICQFIERLNKKTLDNKFYFVGNNLLASVNPVSDKLLEQIRKDISQRFMLIHDLSQQKGKSGEFTKILLKEEDSKDSLSSKVKSLFRKKSINFNFYEKDLKHLEPVFGKGLSKYFVKLLDGNLIKVMGQDSLKKYLGDDFEKVAEIIKVIKDINAVRYAEDSNFSVKNYFNLFSLSSTFPDSYHSDSLSRFSNFSKSAEKQKVEKLNDSWKKILMGQYISGRCKLDKVFKIFVQDGSLIDFLKMRDSSLKQFDSELSKEDKMDFDLIQERISDNFEIIKSVESLVNFCANPHEIKRLETECGDILLKNFFDFEKVEIPGFSIIELNLNTWDCFKEQDYAFTKADVDLTLNKINTCLQQGLNLICDINPKLNNNIKLSEGLKGDTIPVLGDLTLIVNNSVQNPEFLAKSIKSVGEQYFLELMREMKNANEEIKHGLVDRYQSFLSFDNLSKAIDLPRDTKNSLLNNDMASQTLIDSKFVNNPDDFSKANEFKL